MKTRLSVFILILLMLFSSLEAKDWFKVYAQGIKAMKKKDYPTAIAKFEQCLKVKKKDNKKIRTYGMHFIKYFPNREIGIAHYHLGNEDQAKKYLQKSLRNEPTARAMEFLNRTSGAESPGPVVTNKPVVKEKNVSVIPEKTPVKIKSSKTASNVKVVGERMSVAVFPFENKGASRDLGEIVLDKMITSLFNKERFKVIERSQLEKVMNELKLGASGIIDNSTAAELGKGIGVDGIILGSVAATSSGAISIDSRIIDTETATIIVAHDAYSQRSDAQSIKKTIDFLADKFITSLPLVSGSVIRIDGGGIMVDLGRNGGIKKGIKCTVYRDGNEVKHPVTGEVLGKETIIIGEIQINSAFDLYATGRLLKTENGNTVQVGDKFVTK